MATSEKLSSSISTSRLLFWVALILFLLGITYCIFLYVDTNIGNHSMESDRAEIARLQMENDAFFQSPDFEKYIFMKEFDAENHQMPRSEHIARVNDIFKSVEDVEDGSINIILSDFQISLDAISLKGFVTNLRILYYAPEGKTSLFQKFQNLQFLHDISVKTYTRSTEKIGYNFVLTAKVENNYDK